MDKISIIGTGLIGTSLGLAIKQSGIKDVEIVGTDVDRRSASKAQKIGAIDRVEGNMGSAVDNAEIVFIATPVTAMRDVMEIISSRLSEGCLVTDTGASKGIVMEWAEEYLPRNVTFVGGDPMVGTETSGSNAAAAALFHNRPYCVIPGKNAQQDKVRLLTDLVRAMGAKPYFIDVGEHDAFVSVVNQLPILISVALVGCTSKSPSWDDIAQIASTQYGDITSLASNNVGANKDIFFGNDQGIVHWIDAFIKELYEMRQILAEDGDSKSEGLEKYFSEALDARSKWLGGLVTPASQAATNRERRPPVTEGLVNMFIGDPDARRRVFGWGRRRGRDSKDKK